MNRVLAGLLLAGLALGPVGCAKKTPEDLLKSAQQSMQSRDTMGATIKLKDLIKKHPDSTVIPEANYMLAYCYYNDKDFDTAREYLQKNVDQLGLGSDMGQISFLNIVQSFQNEGKLDKAIELARGAVEKADKASEFGKTLRFTFGNLLAQKGDKEEARKVYGELADSAQTDEETMQALKSIEATYDLEKDLESVVGLYKGYLQNHPETKLLNVLRFNLALLYRHAEKKDEATQYYDEALAGFGEEIEKTLDANQKSLLMVQMGKVHELWDEPAKAEETYLAVVNQFPQSQYAPQALGELASYMAQRKDFDKAEMYLNKIIKDYPPLAPQVSQQLAIVQRMRMAESVSSGTITITPATEGLSEPQSPAASPTPIPTPAAETSEEMAPLDTVNERAPSEATPAGTNPSSPPKTN